MHYIGIGPKLARMRHADPYEEVLEEIHNFWSSQDDVFGRICEFVFKTDGYRGQTYISEKSECSVNAASKHLSRLAQLGLVERNKAPSSIQYRRNEQYLEWRVLYHIVENYSMEEIIERVAALEDRQESLVDQDGVVPRIASTSDVTLHENVASGMEAANELEYVRRRIRLYEIARQVLQNDGHLGFNPL